MLPLLLYFIRRIKENNQKNFNVDKKWGLSEKVYDKYLFRSLPPEVELKKFQFCKILLYIFQFQLESF